MTDNVSNVRARYQLLKSALQGSKQVPVALLKGCKSQGALANLHLSAEGIFPMALNTLKANADKSIENGGWKKLDEMRKAYRSSSQKTAPAQTHITNIKAKLSTAEHALDTERRYRIRLQVAYEALLSQLKVSSNHDPNLAQFINRHLAGFSFKRLSVIPKFSDPTDE